MRSSLHLVASLQAMQIVGATDYATATSSASANIRAHRRAVQTFLDLYKTENNVNYLTELDLDQRAVVSQLSRETPEGMEEARNIYTLGSYSKPFAELKLVDGLSTAVKAGTTVRGFSSSEGVEVVGTVMVDTKVGDKILLVEYDTESFDPPEEMCRVGGTPIPITTRCFASAATIILADTGTNYSYSYSILSDNKNGFTLQSLSSQAREVMYDCEGCPHRAYNAFFDYYGEFDYADRWIQAAFNGSSTSLKYGNADFSKFDLEARTASIKWGIVVLNVWMYVVNNLEDAIENCDSIYNYDPIESLDRAVAAYTGWEVQRDHINGGHLLFTHAQIECAKFGTCNEDGLAIVNGEIFMNFVEGKKHLLEGRCEHAKEHLRRITTLMVVPLIQGVLRTAYMMDVEEDHQGMTQGQGFAFAASLLPLLHACDPNTSAIVYKDFEPGEGLNGNFYVVKHIVERSYQCLQITCEEVGGLVSLSGDGYIKDAGPCTKESSSDDDDAELATGGTGTTTSTSKNNNYDYAEPAITTTATTEETSTSNNYDYAEPATTTTSTTQEKSTSKNYGYAEPAMASGGSTSSATEQSVSSFSSPLVNGLVVALGASLIFAVVSCTTAMILFAKVRKLQETKKESRSYLGTPAPNGKVPMESADPEEPRPDKEII